MGGAQKARDEIRARESDILHCPFRHLCPAGALCASENAATPLYPMVRQVEPGEIVWSDLRFEQRITIFRSGVFALTVTDRQTEREVPVSLFGPGDCTGFAELYIPRTLGDYYFLKTLTPGSICSFPAKPFRHAFEDLPSPGRDKTLACTLVNPTSAQYSQIQMLTRPKIYDRLVMLFSRIRDLSAREGRCVSELSLTHEDLAALVASDRVSVTRALHKLVDDGVVEVGYRCIRFCEKRFEEAEALLAAPGTYLHPDKTLGFGS